MSKQINGSKINWTVFIGVISILIIGIGWNISRAETLAKQVEDYRQDVQNTKILLASIQTDLVWIKTSMINLQDSLDKHIDN